MNTIRETVCGRANEAIYRSVEEFLESFIDFAELSVWKTPYVKIGNSVWRSVHMLVEFPVDLKTERLVNECK